MQRIEDVDFMVRVSELGGGIDLLSREPEIPPETAIGSALEWAA
jgi:hypothetical protein